MRTVYTIAKKLLRDMYGDWTKNPALAVDIQGAWRTYCRAIGIKGPLYITEDDDNYYVRVDDAHVRGVARNR